MSGLGDASGSRDSEAGRVPWPGSGGRASTSTPSEPGPLRPGQRSRPNMFLRVQMGWGGAGQAGAGEGRARHFLLAGASSSALKEGFFSLSHRK